MKITKFGHCCLLIEDGGVRLLTDPGSFTIDQHETENIDAVLITHEHADHLHMDSLKAVITKNPNVQVITNSAVAKLLDAENISYSLLGDQQHTKVKEILIEAFELEHAEIYPGLPHVLNTGFFIGEKLFYPGDAWVKPNKPVDVLAFPTSGPWFVFREAFDYLKEVKPNRIFGVHDALLSDTGKGLIANFLGRILGDAAPEYINVTDNEPFEV